MSSRALKLDQNVPERVARQFTAAGFDTSTVREQGMEGAPDSVVYSVCNAEDRVLVTFDLDFADIRAYPPKSACGTIVLRPPSQDARAVSLLVGQLISVLLTTEPRGELWIAEDGRIRVRGDG